MIRLVEASTTEPFGKGNRSTLRRMGLTLQNQAGSSLRRNHAGSTRSERCGSGIPGDTSITTQGPADQFGRVRIGGNGNNQIGHPSADHRTRHPENLGSGGGSSIQGEDAPPQAMTQRDGGTHGVSPPSAYRIGGKFGTPGFFKITLHGDKTTERASSYASEPGVPMLSPLTPDSVSLLNQPRRTPCRFHDIQGKQLMTGKNRGISRSKADPSCQLAISRNLPLGLRSGTCQIPERSGAATRSG